MEFVHFPRRIQLAIPSAIDTDWEQGDNWLITGPAASGKSIKAAGMVIHNLANNLCSARWVPADDYVEWIKDSFNNDGALGLEYSNPYLIKNVKAVYDIIVLDGLGEERRTDFAVHELGSLIRKRYDDGRTTIITTRLTPEEVVSRYGTRISAPLSTYELEVTSAR